jgi:energy-coupling factor transporter ATP-binding protein EcfA2
MPTAPAKLPPPPKANGRTQQPAAPVDRSFPITSGRLDKPQRIVLYGPGGIGKSTLAALAPGVVMLDVESGTYELDVNRVDGIDSFAELRACLQSDALNGAETVVIDSATRTEELAIAHTLASRPHEKGHHVDNIEGYGFGKGYQHVYDTFLLLLQDLDAQVRAGRNVVLVAHDCVDNVPNPTGDDWIRYEPHLQSPRSGKASIRNRVIQWANHVLFVGYDVVAKDGKGRGGGTRTIYPAELPTHRAKSRTLPPDPIPFEHAADDTVWQLIFGGAQ